MMSHLSFSTIEKQLGWPDIRLERHEQTVDGQFNITNIVRVYPSQEQLPFIEFHFQGEFEFLCSLGFAEWHTHFDDTESVDEALELAKLLIERKRCVLEIRSERGKHLGSYFLGPENIPDSLHKSAKKFRRYYFNLEADEETIDFSNYYEGKHGWIEIKSKQSVEKLYLKHGIEIPEW